MSLKLIRDAKARQHRAENDFGVGLLAGAATTVAGVAALLTCWAGSPADVSRAGRLLRAQRH